MAQEVSPPAGPWTSHPAFSRYWRHHRLAAAWMRTHRSAYRAAVAAYVSTLGRLVPGLRAPGARAGGGRGHAGLSGDPGFFPARPGLSGDPQLLHERPGDPRFLYECPGLSGDPRNEDEDDDDASGSDGGVECDLSAMEITEELRQFFSTTERHREERRRQQQLDAARLDDYVDADHDLYRDTRRSAEPPVESPGARRQAELRRLYGAGAARIGAMEAALQLDFDRLCDRRRPKYWPVIPLRF